MRTSFRSLTLTGLALAGAMACAQTTFPKNEPVSGVIFHPEKLEFSEERMRQLRLPEGYQISVFAQGLTNPRMMCSLADGTVYVTCPGPGEVVMLKDGNGDGKSDSVTKALPGLENVHGITRRGNQLYLATITDIMTYDIGGGGALSNMKKVVTDLPQGGQHYRRTLGFGPDGRLYIGIGSRTNDRPAPHPEDACIMRMTGDGRMREVFASGLRNTMGFDWHPVTKQMWGVDQSSDYRGNDIPDEELNLIEEKGAYGWPWAYAKQKIDPNVFSTPKGFKDLESYVKTTKPSMLEFPAHCSLIDFKFYDHTAFPRTRGDAFVTLRGSWNRYPAVGYKVMRVHFDDKGMPERAEDFVDGFLMNDGKAYLGRVAGLAVLPDGSLLIAEDTNGIIYRVSRK